METAYRGISFLTMDQLQKLAIEGKFKMQKRHLCPSGPTKYLIENIQSKLIVLSRSRSIQSNDYGALHLYILVIQPYLIFVIFFTQAKFLKNKIYTEKRQFLPISANLHRNLHRKTPFFANFCQFFALHLKKFTPAKKNLHGRRPWRP